MFDEYLEHIKNYRNVINLSRTACMRRFATDGSIYI